MTDGRTDRRTEFSSLDRITCSAVKSRSGDLEGGDRVGIVTITKKVKLLRTMTKKFVSFFGGKR